MIDPNAKPLLVTASTIAVELDSPVKAIHTLRKKGQLEAVKVGKKFMFPTDAAKNFIQSQVFKPCPDQEPPQPSKEIKSAEIFSTSTGQKTDAAANEARLQGMKKKLKSILPNSSKIETGKTDQNVISVMRL